MSTVQGRAFHAGVERIRERLGVDIPADLKTEVAIKALRDGLSMTDIVIRLLRAWLDGKIKLTQ